MTDVDRGLDMWKRLSRISDVGNWMTTTDDCSISIDPSISEISKAYNNAMANARRSKVSDDDYDYGVSWAMNPND
jgi:hypothetical protein